MSSTIMTAYRQYATRPADERYASLEQLITVAADDARLPIPEPHRLAAERFRRFFKPVPMTDAEHLPDPDYGL